MQPSVQSEIFELHFQRLSRVPVWRVLPCVVGEFEGCCSALVRGGEGPGSGGAISRTDGCVPDIF